MTDKTKITLVTVIVIAILAVVAMLKGIDGALYMTALTLIGGLAGYELKSVKDRLIK